MLIFGTGSAHFKVNFRSALMYICVLRINVFVTIYIWSLEIMDKTFESLLLLWLLWLTVPWDHYIQLFF